MVSVAIGGHEVVGIIPDHIIRGGCFIAALQNLFVIPTTTV